MKGAVRILEAIGCERRALHYSMMSAAARVIGVAVEKVFRDQPIGRHTLSIQLASPPA